ncbi:MAG: Gfo/Idh/MocA family oxidoreductase [Acidimicrobiales bacterium]
MRVAVAGAGAFGLKHLDALQQIEGVEIAAVVSRRVEQAREVALTYGAPLATDQLTDVLEDASIDAVILSTPTQLHAEQAMATMRAGKHVQIEIPLADRLSDALAVDELARETGLTCMVGHTRRFNPSHQWIHQRVLTGELNVLQMDVQTYFFRRTNTNALGQPRSWTDNLLWHHAAHTVDLFAYQTLSPIDVAHGLAGPVSSELGIPLDMSIQLQSRSESLCTLSLSFNNDGPFGTFFRYICDNGTYFARYDDLITGGDEAIDLNGVAVSSNGIELQDREFVAAILEGREPNSSVHQVLGCYQTLDVIQKELDR